MSNDQGTVFVTQEPMRRQPNGSWEPIYDLSPAAAYGKLEVLLDPRTSILSPGPVVFEMRKRLRNFCDDDHILAMGDPIAIGIASAMAADANRGRVAMLKWDRETRNYIRVQFDMRDTKVRKGA